MSTRYPLLSQTLAVAGSFVVLATFAFGRGAANAIDFGVIIGITVVAAAALAVAPRTRAQLALSAGTLVVGAWTILVTAGIYSGATQRWLTFAGGVAVAAASVAGHTLYDLARERRSSGRSAALGDISRVDAAAGRQAA
jgi:hypothetical protein